MYTSVIVQPQHFYADELVVQLRAGKGGAGNGGAGKGGAGKGDPGGGRQSSGWMERMAELYAEVALVLLWLYVYNSSV